MPWQFILVLILVIPFILLPIVPIWYMNISGLYQIMREVRQRIKRKAHTFEGAEELARR